MALRGAIVGLGNVAVHGHLPGWLAREDVAIVAATDTNPAREAELRRRLPGARWYPSVEALWAGQALDFVDICTPPGTHAELIRAALLGGRHVLCEKPLVTCIEDLEALAGLAAARGRVLYTVHNWHQAPVVRRVNALLGEGAIGEVHRCTWQTLRGQPAGGGVVGAANWRVDPSMAGGGILVDHGWHALYVVGRWMGLAPSRLSARLETRRHTQWPIEDTATLRLEWPAARAEVFLTWAADRRRNEAKLEGSRGTIHVQDETVVLAPSSERGPEGRWVCPPALSDGSYHPDWFEGVASEFVAAVTGAPAARAANLAEASLCATLVAAAQASDRRGGAWLPVSQARPQAVGPGSRAAGGNR